MATYPVPTPPKVYTLNLAKFRGVDFANDPSQVDPSRSPSSKNMISDLGGFPVKRTGYSEVFTAAATVNGVYRLVLASGTYRLVHAGTKLYTWDGADGLVEIAGVTMANARSTAFQMVGKLWILDGTHYYKYDGTNVTDATTDAYIPITRIAMTPAGAGTVYEGVNLIQSKQTRMFLGTVSDTVYNLDDTPDTGSTVTVYKMNLSGGWDLVSDSEYTFSAAAGTVTFGSAPGVSPKTGEDNIKITYTKTVSGYSDKIKKCTIYAIYGKDGRDDRVFLSGNPGAPNTDWYSGINDPTYFSDVRYSQIGRDSSAIMGYRKVGKYLSIHKQDNGQDATVYLRSGELGTIGDSTIEDEYFPVQQGIAGVGAISKYAFANLADDPMFLSAQGMMAIVTNDITGERFAQRRSFFVDKSLVKESTLSTAVAHEFDGNLYVAAGKSIYVADSRQKTVVKEAYADSFQYEWFYWELLHAVSFFYEESGYLYFASDTKLMKFYHFGDVSGYADAGTAFTAYWDTTLLDFGTITQKKTIKGAWVMFCPYAHSSAKIFHKIKSDLILVKESSMNFFDFSDVDFTEFTFETDSSPRVVPTNVKAKGVILLQFRIMNDVEKPFGLYQITATYTVGSKYKG